MDLPPDGAYGPPLPSSPLSIKLVWVVSTKNSPAEICLVRYRQLLDSMYPNQVVWQPYEAELGHLPAFCVAGRDMWTARVPLVAMHKQMLMRYVVDSPEHKLITAMLKEVDRLHRLAAHLPLEDADTTNPELPEQNARPSTSSTPASHSHGQCAAPHQRQNQPPPPPHASPAPEFPPPPHASPSPEIPPRTTPAFPDLQIPVPTAHASSHPEIPSPTLCGHKAGHKAGPTQCKEPDQGDAIPPPPRTRHYTRQHKRQVP
ncbi:hypothetical protein CMV_000086 [Castanea mollissima]|uniref:Aminotransferase-like plant mobile domain-containing protein n=1 Tax=Castanea mollissima TaxID=60419 RepID=A0A8J4W5I2_9ROSI|nr:hypothetical protein CMV_000086 [Castanea mollissima]